MGVTKTGEQVPKTSKKENKRTNDKEHQKNQLLLLSDGPNDHLKISPGSMWFGIHRLGFDSSVSLGTVTSSGL